MLKVTSFHKVRRELDMAEESKLQDGSVDVIKIEKKRMRRKNRSARAMSIKWDENISLGS